MGCVVFLCRVLEVPFDGSFSGFTGFQLKGLRERGLKVPLLGFGV